MLCRGAGQFFFRYSFMDFHRGWFHHSQTGHEQMGCLTTKSSYSRRGETTFCVSRCSTSAEEPQGQSTQLLQRFDQSPEVSRGWEMIRSID